MNRSAARPRLGPPDAIRVERMSGPSGAEVITIEPHLHPRHFQLMFARSGDCVVDLDRQSQSVASPCFLSIPSGYVHGFALRGSSVGWVLTVPDSLLQLLCGKAERRLTEPFLSAPTLMTFDADPDSVSAFVWLMQRLEEESALTDGVVGPALESLLGYLLVRVLRRLGSDASDSKKTDRDRLLFSRFRRLVEERYTEHWSVGRFSGALGVSAARLNRLCIAHGGATAYEIVLNRLCLEAQRRLLYTSAPASRIALSLGFQDAAYFSRFFRRRVGIPPGEFREGGNRKPGVRASRPDQPSVPGRGARGTPGPDAGPAG